MIILQILVGTEPDVCLTWEFPDWYKFKEFIELWMKYAQCKTIKAKVKITEGKKTT